MAIVEKVPIDLAEESADFIFRKFLNGKDIEVFLRSYSYGGAGMYRSDDEVEIITRGAETLKFIVNSQPRVVVKIPKGLDIWQKVTKAQTNGNRLLDDSGCPNFAPLTTCGLPGTRTNKQHHGLTPMVFTVQASLVQNPRYLGSQCIS
jgi:hypothetical protein